MIRFSRIYSKTKQVNRKEKEKQNKPIILLIVDQEQHYVDSTERL